MVGQQNNVVENATAPAVSVLTIAVRTADDGARTVSDNPILAHVT